jgi:DNA repair protein RecO (recombination protein O)
VPLYSDEAIVLRTRKLAEADRIITLLTRQHGVVRAVARGRTSHVVEVRLAARAVHPRRPPARGGSQPRHGDPGGDTRPVRAAISADYDRYTAASVMLETSEHLVAEEREPSVQQYLLLVGGLRAMTAGERRPSDVLDSFLLRSLAVAGYAPSFDACARCGLEGPHRAFNPAHGGMLCPRLPAARLGPSGTRDGDPARRLLAGDWPLVETADVRSRKEAAGLVSAYLSWHLERGLRSLPYVTSLGH